MEERVKYPAIALMIVAVLKLGYALLNLASNTISAAGINVMQFLPQQPGMQQTSPLINVFSGAVGIVFSLVGIGIAGTVLFGAFKMSKLENWTLAIVAAALACIPCDCCCCFGIPVGIWAIVTLLDQQVKESFR